MGNAEKQLLLYRLSALAETHAAASERDDKAHTPHDLADALAREGVLDEPLIREAIGAIRDSLDSTPRAATPKGPTDE